MNESEATDALVDRLGRLDGLSETLDSLRQEVVGLRSDLSRKPSNRELDYKRRRLAWFLIAYTVVVISLHDQHVEHCGPGTRLTQTVPTGCDVLFPLHAHDRGFPNEQSALGAVLYVAVLGALWVWVRQPLRRRSDDD